MDFRPAALAALYGLAACGLRGARPAPPPLPLDAELAGCASVRSGPICEVTGASTLTVWARVPVTPGDAGPTGASIRVAVDGHEVQDRGTPVEDGMRFRVPVAPDARELSVTAVAGARRGTFRMPIVAAPVDPALREAERLRLAGALDPAERALQALMPGAPADLRARLLGNLARIAHARGRPESIDLFRQAAALDRETGRVSDEMRDRLALSYELMRAYRFAEARGALDALAPIAGECPEKRAHIPYHLGLIAMNAGDLRAALGHLREAEARMERLGLESEHVDALEMEANTLRLLGRHAEAMQILEAARASGAALANGCQRADLTLAAAWVKLDAETAVGPPDPLGSVPRFEEAASLYRRDCPKPRELSNVLTDLARISVLRGEVEPARRFLDEARRTLPGAAELENDHLEIEGRIALAAGDPRRALEAFERLGRRADRELLRDVRREAAIGRARALEALGRVEDARAAHAAADRELDELSALVPLGEGKETFFGRREEGTRRRIDFLLRHDEAEAAEAARRARARILASLRWADRLGALDAAERDRWEAALADFRRGREALDAEAAGLWKLSADKLAAAGASRRAREAALRARLDEALATLAQGKGRDPASGAPLAKPAPGEVILVYHPLPEGWAAFAIATGGVTARRLPRLDPAASPDGLSHALLVPLRDALVRAETLRVLPYGPLAAVDFHALPYEGAPLVARFPIAYGLDQPVRGAAAPAPDEPRALVVADARGDLPAARGEADEVAATLASRPGLALVRVQGDEATHARVRDAIEAPTTAILHYAGHGVFEGRDGWESGLPLAAGGWLTVADVLALGHAPSLVVLSGCETARTTREARAAGLGIAQAFVIAGARAAVAATRPVDDALAGRLMASFHQALARGLDPPGALREAALAALAHDPASDWASFRVLLP